MKSQQITITCSHSKTLLTLSIAIIHTHQNSYVQFGGNIAQGMVRRENVEKTQQISLRLEYGLLVNTHIQHCKYQSKILNVNIYVNTSISLISLTNISHFAMFVCRVHMWLHSI